MVESKSNTSASPYILRYNSSICKLFIKIKLAKQYKVKFTNARGDSSGVW